MNNDGMVHYVAENPFVGGRLSPFVMLWLKAIDRDNQIQLGECRPVLWKGTERAGDKLHENSHPQELGQQDFQLPKPDQRISAHNGEVKRPVPSHQAQHSRHESLASKVAQAP
jgi:hypothetical protein